MSFHPFFSDVAPPDLQDHLSRHPDPYHHPSRPPFPYDSLPYFQEDPAYYGLCSFPKLELPPSQSYPTPFLSSHPYPSTSTYHLEHALDLTSASTHQLPPPTVKQEPVTTPTSPQFIFEFPGGEEDPPPFDLSPSASPVRPTPNEHVLCHPPTDIARPPRPTSPTTDAMRAMMGFFRVDPFASYDTDPTSHAFPSSRHPKRRKRSSTYALTTNPEASSREEPLMLTFQLEVSDEHGGGGGPKDASPEPEPCQWPGVPDSPEPLALSGAAAAITHAGGAGEVDHVFPTTTDSDTYPHAFDIHASELGTASSSYRLHPVAGSRFADANPAFYTTASQQQQQPFSNTLFDPYSAVSRSSNSTPDSTDSFSLSFFPNWLPRPTSAATHVDAITATTSTNTRPSPRGPPRMHVCWICQKEFTRPSSLMAHINTHSGLKPYKCPVAACPRTFTVRSNARRHMKIHGGGGGPRGPGSSGAGAMAAYPGTTEPGSSDSPESPGSESEAEAEAGAAARAVYYPASELALQVHDADADAADPGSADTQASVPPQDASCRSRPFQQYTLLPAALRAVPGPASSRPGLIATPSLMTTVGAY